MNTIDLKIPSSLSFVRSFQGFDEYVLDNGLKVLLFFDPSQANVTVNITYLVGSRHEGRGEAGMAHLLEHMLFRGTKDMRDVKGALQDKGAQFNATTWYDRTNYFEIFTPTTQNLEFALKLEADRMVNSLILDEDLDAEMTVVRNEFEMGENNPVHVLHDQLMSSAYRWHNYGRPTIGNRSDIERVPGKALRKFYENYYQPDNAVLIVAGQFDKQAALDLINEYFGVIKRPSRFLDDTYTEEPAQDGPRHVEVLRVGDMASVAVGYHIPAASHKDHASLKIFFDFLADEPGGLLYEGLIEKGLCSEVFSMVYSLHEPGMALCFVRPTKDDAAFSIRDALIDLVEEKALRMINEEQVERMKKRALKRIKLSMTSSKDLAVKLSEAIACGDWRLFFWHRDQIKLVTEDDVKRVALRYIMPSNRTAGIFLPIKTPVRANIEKAPPLSELVSDIKDDPSLTGGDVFVATTKNIEQLLVRRKDQHKKMAFLQKKTRGQSVKAQLRFHFANETALSPFVKEYWLIPSLLWRGTSKFSFQQLRDRIDGLMSTLELDGHAGLMAATIKSEHSHVGDMLDLLAHMLKEPAFKADEFLIVKQREIDNYEEIRSDPQRLGFQTLERLKHPWPKDNIHYVHSFDEIIEALTNLSLDRVKDSYQLFSSQHAAIAIVGDCEPSSLIKKMANWFLEKDRAHFERVTRPFIANVVDDIVLDTKDKEMAIIAWAYNFTMRDDHEDYPALKLANYMFGENMNSRLMHRIREREGISYGAGSQIEIGRHEENASLNIYAMAAPSSISRGKRAIEEEWQKFIEQGVSEEEVKLAKESIWLSFENRLGNDGYLAGALAHDLEIDRDFYFRENIYKRMKELSSKDIKNVVDKWWSKAEFSKVCAVDVDKMK